LPERAIQLEEFGIRNNPNEWRLYYNDGFIHYMELKDYAGAAEAFARGAKVPNAHPFLAIMAAKMAEHAGDLQMARLMWSTTYEGSKDSSVRANAAAHLRALQVDEDVTNLEAAIGRYRQMNGRLRSSFSDLEAAGLIQGTPADPLGHPYKVMPDGRVEVQVPDDLPFINKGLPPNYVPPPAPKFLPTD
jgi:tetratricopeptide (TPR) repeat protein